MRPLLIIEDSDSGTSEMTEATFYRHMGLYNTDRYLTFPLLGSSGFFPVSVPSLLISEYVESEASWPSNSTKSFPSFWL